MDGSNCHRWEVRTGSTRFDVPMHVPVMLEEVLVAFQIRSGGRYIDGTTGGGGHTEALLRASDPNGRVLALDRDSEAVDQVTRQMAPFGNRCVVVQGNFSLLRRFAVLHGFESVDGILLDLGVSSLQLDEGRRGFGFSQEGPLDMRMDRTQVLSVEKLIQTATEEELARLIWEYGEERDSRRVARGLVRAREQGSIQTTTQLAEIVSRAKGGRRGRIHPATKTFQALRIAVNDEFNHLHQGLDAAVDMVRTGGRLAVISFHSLEDRIVKKAFAAHVGRNESLPLGGTQWVGRLPAFTWVRRKPITPTDAEIRRNPRSRSAKLRVIERKE